MAFRAFALLALAAVAAAKNNRKHFYTTYPDGGGARQGGYTEGPVVGYAYDHQVDGSIPMYRCYNRVSDLYFFTTASNCEGAPNYGLQPGPAWYSFPSQSGNLVPLDRYSQGNGDHWYVQRGQEQQSGDLPYYNYEGVATFVYPQQQNGAIPIYNWYKGSVR